jgi:DNA-binding NarL/FixJ family response regulator
MGDLPGIGERRHRILLVTSRHFGWAGLREALRQAGNVRIVGETSRSDNAAEKAALLQPDAILAAADLECSSMAELVDRLRGNSSESKIILVGEDRDRDSLRTAFEVPAHGYFSWQEVGAHNLHLALAAVLEAGCWVASPGAVSTLAARQRDERQRHRVELTQNRRLALRGFAAELTERERSMLDGFDDGLTAQEMGERLSLLPRTRQRVQAGLFKKLGARTPFELGKRTVQLGLHGHFDVT